LFTYEFIIHLSEAARRDQAYIMCC